MQIQTKPEYQRKKLSARKAFHPGNLKNCAVFPYFNLAAGTASNVTNLGNLPTPLTLKVDVFRFFPRQ